MTKTKPTADETPVLHCLGCDVTHEDIDRLKLDIVLPTHGAPILVGTDIVLPMCSRCIDSPEALTRAMAKEMADHDGACWEVTAALLTLRDKAVFGDIVAHTAESAAVFAKAGDAVVPWFKLAGERLDRLEAFVGIDAESTKPAKNQRAKNGLMGMIGGALIGAIVGSAAKPLEALKAVIDKGHELVEDALRRGAEKQ